MPDQIPGSIRIRTDDSNEWRYHAVERAASLYECNRSNAAAFACNDVAAFVVAATSVLERDNETSYGTAIKTKLERQYGTVNHGRLYPNLDTLSDRGLVDKSALDRRTNEYQLTAGAQALLTQRAERLADACEMKVVATDGGDFE